MKIASPLTLNLADTRALKYGYISYGNQRAAQQQQQ